LQDIIDPVILLTQVGICPVGILAFLVESQAPQKTVV